MKLPIVIALAGMLFGCDRKADQAPAPGPEAVRASRPAADHSSLAAEPAASGAPLYDLRLTLTTQEGRRVGLDVFRGQPLLISMFYGSCGHACPVLISDIKRLEKQLPEAAQASLRVLLVSFDPDRDTPERLKALAALHNVDPKRWIFASAADPDALSLAAALGIRYAKLPSGAFHHTSLITLLDASGKIVAQSEGLGRDNAALVRWLVQRS